MTNSLHKIIFITALLSAQITCWAHPSHWTGSFGQITAAINTGNTNTKDVLLKTVSIYTQNSFKNKLFASFQFGQRNNVTAKSLLSAGNETDYAFRNDFFGYSLVHGELNRFSPYRYIVSGVVGMGVKIVNTPKTTLLSKLGLGMRLSEIRANGQDLVNAVVESSITLHHHINTQTTFTQSLAAQLSVTGDQPFNKYSSKTALTTSLTNHLSGQLSVEVEMLSDIPPGATNTSLVDTKSLFSLIYKI